MGNPKKKVDSGPALYEAQISLAVVPGYLGSIIRTAYGVGEVY